MTVLKAVGHICFQNDLSVELASGQWSTVGDGPHPRKATDIWEMHLKTFPPWAAPRSHQRWVCSSVNVMGSAWHFWFESS